jgi:dolichol-phosphate mannosyltransferase
MNVFVVPAYDEEANLPGLLADLESRPDLWRDGGRLVLVDDGSRDRTAEVAERHAGPLPVEVIRLGVNRGPGHAFRVGFRRALELAPPDGFVVTLEADTTSDLDALARMLALAGEEADVVLASVHDGGRMENVSLWRRFLSRGAAFAIRSTAGLDARTVSSFFRVYRASILREAFARFGDATITEAGFACQAELLVRLVRLHACVREVPVALDGGRREGHSKLPVAATIGGYLRLTARELRYRVGVSQ